MPTENEVKYVLKLKCELDIMKRSEEKKEIIQGYLISANGTSLRVRCAKKKNKTCYYLTYKHKYASRVIEIETKIDERDFLELYDESLNKLAKTRYCYKEGDCHWDIDFFRMPEGMGIYFVLAECEMPEGMEVPLSIPDFIEKNIIWEVGLTDTRFSSRKLSDRTHASKVYKEIFKCQENMI